MHFNIYVDDHMGQQLTLYAEQHKITRNSLIRDALDRFLQSELHIWPPEILEFTGISDFPAFESFRQELLPIKEDPFA